MGREADRKRGDLTIQMADTGSCMGLGMVNHIAVNLMTRQPPGDVCVCLLGIG